MSPLLATLFHHGIVAYVLSFYEVSLFYPISYNWGIVTSFHFLQWAIAIAFLDRVLVAQCTQ
jgi:hypothetical protein